MNFYTKPSFLGAIVVLALTACQPDTYEMKRFDDYALIHVRGHIHGTISEYARTEPETYFSDFSERILSLEVRCNQQHRPNFDDYQACLDKWLPAEFKGYTRATAMQSTR